MNENLTDVWNNISNILKNELSGVSYATWVQPVTPISLDKNILVICVPYQLNKDMLSNKYGPLLKNSVISVLGRACEIDIKVAENPIPLQKPKNQFYDETQTSSLNPKYLFETFVVGNSNRFAHAACAAVAESPAKAYNPLFLYGGVGLGKTHLMHAIGNHVFSKNPNSNVVYVTSETFTNELINSIKDDKNKEFRAKYRSADVLMLDDIQFIGGKERTEEEFFHTFNTLYEANKQIVLTSDRPPRDIHILEERLRSRFEWGLISDIQLPDLETRTAILKKKAQTENIVISDEIFIHVATHIKSNIRELEGALNRIIAFSDLSKHEITLEVADEALKDFLSPENKVITIPMIQQAVAKHFNLKPEDFKAKNRMKNVAYPRQIAMYISRELTDLSLPDIGLDFGRRDHSTILHGVNKIIADIQTKPEIEKVVKSIIKNIKGR